MQLVGTLIDQRYYVDAEVAADAHRAVYRGRHRHLGEPLCIKVLLATDETDRQRFLREARILYSLRHPHVAEVRDCGVLPSGHPYLIMEPLPEHKLTDLLQHGPLSTPRACHLAAQVAQGLAAAHQLGVIHRGLRPDCVVLPPSGDAPKLTDFSIAAAPTAEALTTDGAILGLPEYLSPEQARGHKADPRADQYALGCVLFHMLCGAPPFTAASAAEILLLQQSALPRFPPHLPTALRHTLARLLHKDPAGRFPSMAEAAAQLAALAERPRRLCVLAAPTRRDRPLLQRFLTHLEPLRQGGQLALWHPDLTPPGEDRQRALEEQLRSADIVALLVSPDLLASPLLALVPPLQQRQHEGSLQLVPIRLRPAHLDPTPLKGLQLLPHDGRALSQLDDPDESLSDIAKTIAALRTALP